MAQTQHRAAPLRFSPDVEQPKPDEADAIQGIIDAMTHQSEIVAAREKHAVRASHAKSTGLAVGTLRVLPNLPQELAQGLFAQPASYDVAVRFAQGPGETLPDKISTHRGMAIKIFGISGEKLPGHADATQDFVLASGPVFPSGTAQGFLRDEKQIEAATSMPAGVKSAVSAGARGTNAVLQALGTESPKADFFGHPYSHPLSEPYYSQAPIRFGDHVAKIAAFPATDAMRALGDERIDTSTDENAFRTRTVGFLRDNDAVFEIRVQLWRDAETQPIEDTSVEWTEAESPFVTVATLTMPRQNAYSDARRQFFDEVMTFRPAHSLAAHRPLGSVMRARLKVYAALSEYRHGHNVVVAQEPSGPTDIPA